MLVLLVMLAAAAATTAIMPSAAPLAVLLILSWSHEHRFLALIQSEDVFRPKVCRTPPALCAAEPI
jgi:hypothetical protein